MIRTLIVVAACTLLCVVPLTQSTADNALDGRAYDPAVDPDIDMFIGSWENSVPVNTHGTITERAILHPGTGDPNKPERKAAVLHYVNAFTHGTLDAGATTSPTTFTGEQEIIYCTSGEGIIRTSGTTADIREGIFVLVPEGCEFTIMNTSDEIMAMYLVREPTARGFRPNPDILVVDEKSLPFREQGQVKGHWSHNGKGIFNIQSGMSVIESIALITINGQCIAHPHSHGAGIEECWTCVEGNLLEMIGTQIRWMGPGTGFKVPPTDFTPHSHINPSKEPVRILLFARWRDHDPRP
jgi:mannose-6-phosphate isomerase-like protein (cupin superfamily)